MKPFAALMAAATTCPRWQLQGAPRAAGHEPWTHAVYCVRTRDVGSEPVCVFTDADFYFGQGISIVARRDTAARMVHDGLLDPAPHERPPTRASEAKYEPLEREGSGVGLFVKPSEVIRAGERVLVDYPTLVNGQLGESVPPDLRRYLQWKAVLQLPGDARRRSRDLAKSRGQFMDEIENLLETNAFTHQKADALHDVLFTEAARINHACRPNVITRTNETTLAMEVIALRDIHAGEEILNSYLDSSVELSSRERQKKISGEWNFSCSCSICAGDGVAESDERRREITKAKERIEAAGRSAETVLVHVKTLLKLYEEEGMIMPRPQKYWLAAVAANALGRGDEAVGFARLARKYLTIMFGGDSKMVADIRELERDPANHPSRPRES